MDIAIEREGFQNVEAREHRIKAMFLGLTHADPRPGIRSCLQQR